MSLRRVLFLCAVLLLATLAVWWKCSEVPTKRVSIPKQFGVYPPSESRKEATENLWRTTVARRTYLLGPEHKETVMSRGHLAYILLWRGKFAEAEKEYRAVLPFKERVFGEEHVFVFGTCQYLAHCLLHQGKLKKDLEPAQRAESGYLKTYGAKASDTDNAKNLRQRIELELKQQQPEEPGK